MLRGMGAEAGWEGGGYLVPRGMVTRGAAPLGLPFAILLYVVLLPFFFPISLYDSTIVEKCGNCQEKKPKNIEKTGRLT